MQDVTKAATLGVMILFGACRIHGHGPARVLIIALVPLRASWLWLRFVAMAAVRGAARVGVAELVRLLREAGEGGSVGHDPDQTASIEEGDGDKYQGRREVAADHR
jgi:hypothetical protein